MTYPTAPTLPQHLTRAAKEAPDRIALIHDAGATTFAELDALSRRYAAGLKALGFGEAVNVTLGLPIVRTSVDHGTALDLAGKGLASAESMDAALALGVQLAGVESSP